MPLLRPKDAAHELGVSVDRLTALARDGELPFVDVGRGEKRPSRRYDPEDIAAFKLRRRQQVKSWDGQLGSRGGAETTLQAIRERLLSERKLRQR